MSTINKKIQKLTKKICKLISTLEYPNQAAEQVCFEVVNRASKNLYEAHGIFHEAMTSYRETWMRIQSEELNASQNGKMQQ